MGHQDVMGRLSAAYRVEIDEATKDRHLADVDAAIRIAPSTAVPTGFALRRRAAATAAAVAVFVAPVGMAVAAESAVPGEILYPLKQVTERVRALVDDDIAATHRVEEVERLVVRGAPISEITGAIERAEAATARLAEDDTLGSRICDIRIAAHPVLGDDAGAVGHMPVGEGGPVFHHQYFLAPNHGGIINIQSRSAIDHDGIRIFRCNVTPHIFDSFDNNRALNWFQSQ